MFFKAQQLHFTGIGGIGMSGIAEILLNLGYQITGSDLKLTPITERLAKMGARIREGHAAENIEGAKALVISSAVDESNPEVQEARRLGIPVIPRGELLAELMRLKFGIAIGGSHGKTTTTSMVATILNHAGLDPTVVVGGKVGTMGGSNARLGQGQFLVVESDESDGSFLKLSPIITVVTNIDREHLDHYRNGIAEIREAFTTFVNKVPFYGASILCLDDENVQQILPDVKRRAITYGFGTQAMLTITHSSCGHLSSDFRLRYRGSDLGYFHLNVPGVHNVRNASAAVAVAMELGVEIGKIREGLAEYAGVDRRFQSRGTEKGITVIDDYGHHPTEIRATLAAARECRYNRLLVIFQPHRYSRTLHLLDDFAKAFHQADHAWVLDIYAASEKPIEGVSAEVLTERMRAFGHRSAQYSGTIDQAVDAVLAEAREGDAILTLGAGNVWQAGDRILALTRRVLMARRSQAATVEAPSPLPRSAARFFSAAGTALNWCILICALVGCVWAVWQIEQFVITDKRFKLEGPPEPGLPSESFQVTGRSNASEQQIVNVFMRDFGRSVYLCPIRERRRRLLAIDWVKEASVSRVWPNRIVVRIKERTPVAFVQIPSANNTTFYGLVDEDGVILDPQRSEPMSLAVLSGISPKEPETVRRERVKRFLRLQTELGTLMDEISEIDVSDPENLKVTQVIDGRAVTLMLGDRDFLQRYRNFLDNHVEIQKRLGNAILLDLRLRDRITVVATAEPDGPAAAAAAPKKLRPKESRPKELRR